MTDEAFKSLAVVMVFALGLLALLLQWLADYRPQELRLGQSSEFVVTSGADDGIGSLREAIFAAAATSGPVRIVLAAPRISLQTPLPPLSHSGGLVIAARESGSVVEAGSLAQDQGPVLDLNTPDARVEGVSISEAKGLCMLVRGSRTHLRKVSFSHCGEGLSIADGAGNVVVEASSFSRNGIGVRLMANAPNATLRNNRFLGHETAAIWSVRAAPPIPVDHARLQVSDNHFQGDRISLVLVNAPATLTGNRFWDFEQTALYATGPGLDVRNNRIRNGAGVGIFADGAHEGLISGNEVDHNWAIGILIRSSQNLVVEKNRVHVNGYGIASVFGEALGPNLISDNLLLEQRLDGIIVIGGSPLIQGNRLLGNRAAGLRILDFIGGPQDRISADPLLKNNTLLRNRLNEPARGEYRVRETVEPS